jgi:hypothetical protein
MTRITALLAAAILALTGLSLVAPAANAQARVDRPISIAWNQVRHTSYVKISGKAQDLDQGKVWLQRKIGKHGTWKAIKSTRSGSTGGYHFKVKVPHTGQTYGYRAKTKKTPKYTQSFSDAIALYWT